ncbi:hypothetical protein [Sandaracinus amylolyticus]|uniref:hypothetical protein n=1 Tax=Sandaracinus amylolyticus TaxID=927083 RepID=UPI001F4886E2|nr:hypothetical protein [Sandaracinus amylolyticus]UJR84571.1 Hypothetical protein I5071_66500 [Sandaracinus amylolyticus]
MRRLLTLVFACLLAACGSTAASTRADSAESDATHPIRFARPVATGASWTEHVQMRSSQRESTRIGAQNVADELTTLAIDFEARFTAREVDARGRAIRLAIAVQRFVVDAGQGPVTPAIPGELIVTRVGEGSIESVAGALDPQTIEWLGEVVHIEAPRDTGDDEIFGSREPQAIGASWGIDTALAARSLGAMGIEVRHDHIGGQTRLVERTRVGDVDCLVVRAELSARQLAVPSLPPNAQITRAEVRATMEAALPIDLARAVRRERTDLRMHIELSIPTEAGTATVRLEGEQQEMRERTDG